MFYLIFSLFVSSIDSLSISNILLPLAKSPFIKENVFFFDVIVCFGPLENQKITKGLTEEGVFVKINSDCNQDILNSIPEFSKSIAYIVDLNCPCARHLLKNAKEKKLFNRPYRWILINISEKSYFINDSSFNQNKTDLSPWIQDYGFHIDTRCLYITPDYRVLELYKTGMNEPLQQDLRAFWENGTIKWNPDNKYKMRMNLQGALIRTATVFTNNDTFNRLDGNYIVNKHIDAVSKVNVYLLKHVAEGLNATYSLMITTTWGFLKPNGEFTGLSGFLHKHEIDLTSSSLFITQQRLKFVDFVAFTTPSMTLIHFRLPPLSYMNNIFILPFSGIVWICCIGLLIGSGFLWRLTLHFEKPLVPGNRVVWSDIVLDIIGAVCQQGSERESRNVSGRIIYLMIFLAIMFFYTSYSACIVALLQSKSDTITSLKDIYESGIGIGAENISYNLHYLSKANDTYSKLIWDNKLDPKKFKKSFMTAEEGIKKLRNEFFGFQMETSRAYKVIQDTFEEDEKCGLAGVLYLKERDPYVGSPRGNNYADHFRVIFLKMKQTGLQQCVYKRFYVSRPQCMGTASSYVSVGLIDFYPALLILIIGLGKAIGFLILEIISFKYLSKKNK